MKTPSQIEICVLLIFVSRQKPSDECWKATATHLTHKTQNGSLNSRGKAGHLKIELQVFISQTGYKKPHGPFYPYMQQMPSIFSCISFFCQSQLLTGNTNVL